MAKTSDQLTVDYRTIMSIPPRDRRALLSSGTVDPLLGVLTPGQRVALFPDYFKQQINGMAGQRSEFGVNAPRTPGTNVNNLPPNIAPAASQANDRRNQNTVGTGNANVGTSVNDPRVRKVLGMIARAEGTSSSYDTQFGYQNVSREGGGGKPLTKMTINEVRELMKNTPANKRAMGMYQFVPDTFEDVVSQMGLKGDELFDPAMQDKMIVHRLSATRGMQDFLDGKISKEKFAQNLSYEFASLPSAAHGGRAAYGGVGLNTSNPALPLSTVLAELEQTSQMPTVAEEGATPGLAQVADDTQGVGNETATAIPEAVMQAGGIDTYTEMRNGVPIKISIDDPIWQTVDPTLAKMRDRLVDADTGLLNRDTLLAADASAKVLRKSGYIPRPVSGGDNHSANHGEGRDANYAIDMAASVEDPQTGQVRNIRAGSELPYEVKRDMAVAAMLSGSAENLRVGMPMSDSDASVHLQYDREKPEGFWGYDRRTASGAEPQRAILETTPEGRRFLSDMDAIRNLSKEKRDELFASVTGQPTEVASASPVPTSPSLTPPATVQSSSNNAMQLATVGDDTKPIGVSTSSMAYGGVLTEPHTAINNRTGARVNLGEVGTGGEAIVPMNKVKANDVGMQPYQMPAIEPTPDSRMPKQADVDKREPAPKNATGQAAQTTVAIAVDHQVVPPSARKAYADAGLEGRFNNFSSIGTQYRSFGL